MHYVFAAICLVLALIFGWAGAVIKMNTSTMDHKLRMQVTFNKKARRTAIITILVLKLILLLIGAGFLITALKLIF